MAEKRVALTTIELGDTRIRPGEAVTGVIDEDSIDELSAHGSIGPESAWAAMQSEQAWKSEQITVTRGRLLEAIDDPDSLRELIRGDGADTSDRRG